MSNLIKMLALLSIAEGFAVHNLHKIMFTD
jgi:hypothetical protein